MQSNSENLINLRHFLLAFPDPFDVNGKVTINGNVYEYVKQIGEGKEGTVRR